MITAATVCEWTDLILAFAAGACFGVLGIIGWATFCVAGEMDGEEPHP